MHSLRAAHSAGDRVMAAWRRLALGGPQRRVAPDELVLVELDVAPEPVLERVVVRRKLPPHDVWGRDIA